jgi:uncharacterized protein (TIGR03382 family)
MFRSNCAVFAGVLVMASATAASADAITTLFGSNNNGDPGGGNYFQIVVGANPIEITGFDVNSLTTGTLGFRVFTTPGTFAGNEGNSAAWTLQASGTANGLGGDIPSPVAMGNSFILAANTSYGIAITLSDPNNPGATDGILAYTNGTGANQSFSDGNLTLNLGTATNVLFTTPIFTPRVWNGTVHYNVVPTPSSLALLGLGGLIAGRRRR